MAGLPRYYSSVTGFLNNFPGIVVHRINIDRRFYNFISLLIRFW